MPPQDVPLWHVDSFELTATMTPWVRNYCSSFNYLEEFKLGIFLRKNNSYYHNS